MVRALPLPVRRSGGTLELVLAVFRVLPPELPSLAARQPRAPRPMESGAPSVTSLRAGAHELHHGWLIYGQMVVFRFVRSPPHTASGIDCIMAVLYAVMHALLS